MTASRIEAAGPPYDAMGWPIVPRLRARDTFRPACLLCRLLHEVVVPTSDEVARWSYRQVDTSNGDSIAGGDEVQSSPAVNTPE